MLLWYDLKSFIRVVFTKVLKKIYGFLSSFHIMILTIVTFDEIESQ